MFLLLLILFSLILLRILVYLTKVDINNYLDSQEFLTKMINIILKSNIKNMFSNAEVFLIFVRSWSESSF